MAHPLRSWTTWIVAGLVLFATPLLAANAEPATAQWVTLGTAGGPQVHANQAQIANAVLVGDAVYLFDVGNGVLRQMAAAKLPVRNVRAIFLSHHHVDHNADVGPLMMSTWLSGAAQSVPVFGPGGTEHLVNGLAAANEPTVLAFFPMAGPAQRPLSSVFSPTDLPSHMNAPQVVYEDANVRVSAITVDHFQVKPSVPLARLPESVAYRVETRGRRYVYSGDTGPSPNLEKLAQGADVLITEVVDPPAIGAAMRRSMPNAPVAMLDALTDSMSKNHLTPANIGRLAARAAVKKVVLTHFVPAAEDQPDASGYTEGIAATFSGPVLLARDLDRF
jgi:ribonuclease BN (tRNA processing enzyme)